MTYRFLSSLPRGGAAVPATFLVLVASPVLAQSSPAPPLPLGIAMEEYAYPYPVRYLPLTIDGEPTRMAYMDIPPTKVANGRAVVLLHGKNFYGAYWRNTVAALTDAGYRVVVPDQIGFGKSSKPDIAYSFHLLAHNTATLLDTLKIAKVSVVGHSMGGMLAVRFARTYPNRTERLVLENPIGLEDYRLFVPPQTLESLTDAEYKQTPETYRKYVASYFVSYPPGQYEPFVTVRTRIAQSGEFDRWAKSSARTFQMIYEQPVRYEFGAITVPTLLVIGQEDRTVVGKNLVSPERLKTVGQYPELGKTAAEDIPNSRLVALPNVGHIPHLEAPVQFHAALLDFLK
ncbi:MAG: alpha/beta hydrolase [Fibrella sp.]|nr:alpha/beta hydrolase [Armatimonadota bacterium]